MSAINEKYDTKNLLEMIDKGNLKGLHKALYELHDIEVAEFLQILETKHILIVFRMLPKDNAVLTFSLLNPETQQKIIHSITDAEIQHIINDLWVDEAVDMLEEMPANLVKKVLRNSSPEIRKLINQYLAYPEDSVGSIMTAEFIEFTKYVTVGEALSSLRDTNQTVETIYTCFITDETRVLLGFVELKDLLLSDDDLLISELIPGNIIKATTTMDKEESADLMRKYDLISLPVVDKENRLVGIVTIDDAFDVIIEEDTEDIEKMAAMTPSEKPYIQTNSFRLAMNRLPWLIVSWLTNVVVTKVFDFYSPVYAAMPILVSYIPMLMGTGGNAGSQTSTIVIRGIALNELSFSDFWKIIIKECGVSALVGATLGIISFIRIYMSGADNFGLALIVAISIFCSIAVGKIVGAILPLVAKKLKFDPALMASPLVSTVVDILIIVLFFSIAQVFFAGQIQGGL